MLRITEKPDGNYLLLEPSGALSRKDLDRLRDDKNGAATADRSRDQAPPQLPAPHASSSVLPNATPTAVPTVPPAATPSSCATRRMPPLACQSRQAPSNDVRQTLGDLQP